MVKLCGLVITCLMVAKASVGMAGMHSAGTTFSVSLQGGRSAPVDGRIILLLSRDLTREPRSHVEPNEPLAVPYLFGLNVNGLTSARAVVIADDAFGWPAAHLSQVPAGDYLVQAVLNRYEDFHLADGRTLKLPPDRGEGQHWAEKPGNLYSIPLRVHVDPAHPVKTSLLLEREIPPVVPKPDTEFVKHLRIRSELLSRFWGRDVYIGAHVLLPKDFDAHPEARFPLMVFHGHYPDDISGFRTSPPDPDLKPDYSERFHLAGYNRIQQQEAYNFYQKWISANFPRFLVIEIETRQSVFRRQLCRQFGQPRSVRRCHQQRVNSADRAAVSRYRRGLGKVYVRRFDRRMGSAGDPSVLPGHVQRRIRRMPGSD